MGKLLADTTPLRASREFRLMYMGQGVSEVGRQITIVALAVQVYDLTGSSLMVGMVGLVQVAPLIIGALTGGTLADAVDRRKILLVLQLAQASMSGLLALNAAQANPRVWVLFTVATVSAFFHGADSPARKATVPRLVTAGHLPASYALIQVMRETARVVGPAFGGLIVANLGFSLAFGIDALTYLWAFVLMRAMMPIPPHHDAAPASFRSLVDGVRFLQGRRLLVANFGVDLVAMAFAMPRALFPEIGLDVLGGTEATVGYLYSAPGAGALIGASTSGWLSHVRRQGRAVVASVAVWSVAIAMIGVFPYLPVVLVLLALAGAADVVSSVLRTTILQLAAPDSVRGRLSAVHTSVVTAGPRLGEAQSGAVAALAGARGAVVLGGGASLIGLALLVRWAPRYWNFQVGQSTLDGNDPVSEATVAGDHHSESGSTDSA